jgi:hypothetical protein
MVRKILVFISLALSLGAQVKLTQGTDRIAVEIDGKPFTDLFIGSAYAKPFLHPLRAASGTVVTRRFPMELVDGEARDHPHHRGLWFTHGDVNGIDFWVNEPGDTRANVGRVVIRRVLDLKDGKKTGSLTASFDWQDPKGKSLLNELRTIVFYSHPRLRMMDFDILLTAIEQVKFGDTKEGTFALRLAPGLEEPRKDAPAVPPRTGKMVSADGKEGEQNVWGTRSPWVDYFGEIDGEKLGVAILDHPTNLRHPTYWHSRSYGLFAANPFGLHDFLRDKSQDGSLTLEPRRSIRFFYRVVIHPGDSATGAIAEMFKTYAAMKLPTHKK